MHLHGNDQHRITQLTGFIYKYDSLECENVCENSIVRCSLATQCTTRHTK